MRKRVDLVLRSGSTLLILEFMQPGKTADFDHVTRFDAYVGLSRAHIRSNTGGPFEKIIGHLVADRIERNELVSDRIKRLEKEEMFALDWYTLLANAKRQWNIITMCFLSGPRKMIGCKHSKALQRILSGANPSLGPYTATAYHSDLEQHKLIWSRVSCDPSHN